MSGEFRNLVIVLLVLFLSRLGWTSTDEFKIFKAEVSAGYDTDPTQSGITTALNLENQRNQGTQTLGTRTLTIIPYSGDQYLLTTLDLAHIFYATEHFQFKGSFAGQSTLYAKQQQFNFESSDPAMEFIWTDGPSVWKFNFNYLDTFYGGNHDQTYWNWTPSEEYSISSHLNLKTEFTFTNATYNQFSTYYMPAITGTYKWGESKVYLLGSYLWANGQRAVITFPPPILVSGNIFSAYTTLTVELGAELQGPMDFFLKGNYSLALTNYSRETIQNSPFQPDPRADTLTSWDLELGHDLFLNWLEASIGLSFRNNASAGLPLTGILSPGSIPNYSYTRWLYVFNLIGTY